MAPAGGEHGYVTVDLITIVNGHVRTHKLGRGFTSETGFIVEDDPRTILAPDYAFIVKKRVPHPMPKRFVPVVPDLVLEKRSFGDRAGEIAAKVELWLEVGAREVWEVNPSRQLLTAYRPNKQPRMLERGDKLESSLLPGLSLQMSEIWE